MSGPGMGEMSVLDHLRENAPDWARGLILAGLRGSDAHGTKLKNHPAAALDDVDTFGVCVQLREWYLGLHSCNPRSRQHWQPEIQGVFDHLIYDVRKFFRLLVKGNPNVHCWLWAEPEDVRLETPAGSRILANRRVFLSRRCLTALAGYASAQLEKMERKRFQGYQGKKRKKLVKRHGYDVKHAAHCVRLLGMGIELATTGEMWTRRPEPEATRLRSIKAGEVGFREVKKEVEAEFADFRVCEERCDLPPEPDRRQVHDLLMDVMEKAWAATAGPGNLSGG